MRVENRANLKRALHMRMEAQQWAKLDAMAKALNLTRSEVVRVLIDSARYSPVVVDVDLTKMGNRRN
jgi:hypothetical protein